MKTIRYLAVMALLTGLASSPVQAQTKDPTLYPGRSEPGYVCRVFFQLPRMYGGGAYGASPNVAFTLTAGPQCTGGAVQDLFLCTEGATSTPYCDGNYLWPADVARAMFESLRQAASAGDRVSVTWSVTGYAIAPVRTVMFNIP